MAGITFIISIPFFFILGYGHVLFYSFVSAIAELIPILGSSVVMIFFGAYALAIGDPRGLFIALIIGYIGVSAIPEIVIRPVLMGRRVELHPIVMFVGFFGGLITLGMVGFVIGPVAITVGITAYRMYRHGPETAGA
jgi:predicted PurR-regulated permease PerM